MTKIIKHFPSYTHYSGDNLSTVQFVIRNEQRFRLALGSIPSRSFDLFVLSESALKVLAMTEDYVNPDFSLQTVTDTC